MVLEPKHKNFKGPRKKEEAVKQVRHVYVYQGLLDDISFR
jgi:hypothetical protein